MDRQDSVRNRYSRQTAFHGIGEEGQERIKRGKAVVIGCGALGGSVAGLLVRAGVGRVRIVDRDFVEYHNLQRQVLFDEKDVAERVPKAVAARRRLAAVNSLVQVEAVVADFNFSNAERLCTGMDVILDGLDNMEGRYLVNDVALKLGIPYVYGGAVSSIGMTMTIIPGRTPCFKCVFPEGPENAMMTCETEGVLGMAPAAVGSFEAAEAIKILVGSDLLNEELISLDVWETSFQSLPIARRKGCPACNGTYDSLKGSAGLLVSSLCGQDRAVQVTDTSIGSVDLGALARSLTDAGKVSRNEYMLSFEAEGLEITVFPDARAIIRNTLDKDRAEQAYLLFIRRNL